ncbi:hypothetical protein L3Q67_12425 [Saccharothrix sp. AJ9571]|nr:hypothetical protein L3Q67_12425 [Saccharothrix sp. AJ9571]
MKGSPRDPELPEPVAYLTQWKLYWQQRQQAIWRTLFRRAALMAAEEVIMFCVEWLTKYPW